MPKPNQKSVSDRPEATSVEAAPTWSAERIGALRSTLETFAVIGAGTAVAVAGVGHLALRQRAQLIDIPEGVIQEPASEMAITGLVALWESLVRAAGTLLTWDALSLVAWACLGGSVLLLWLQSAQDHRRRALLIVAMFGIGVTVVMLFNGLVFRASDSAALVQLEAGKPLEQPSFWEAKAKTMHGWLTEPDGKSKRALALGLVVPLLILASAALRSSFGLVRTSTGLRRPLDHILRAVVLAELLLVLSLLPALYAYWRWGVDYPQVVRVDPACGEDLSALISNQRMQAWLISRGSEQEVLLARYPGRAAMAITLLHPEGGKCSWITRRKVAVPSA